MPHVAVRPGHGATARAPATRTDQQQWSGSRIYSCGSVVSFGTACMHGLTQLYRRKAKYSTATLCKTRGEWMKEST